MADFLENTLLPHFNFWVYVILMMIGLWALIAKNNLIKKLIGLSIFQTAIILFYVSLGVKEDSTIPILDHHAHVEHSEDHHAEPSQHQVSTESHEENHSREKSDHSTHPDATSPDPDTIANPLPHVLMLTAIVVGVATLGVALAISQMIFVEFGTLEEDEILEELKAGNSDV